MHAIGRHGAPDQPFRAEQNISRSVGSQHAFHAGRPRCLLLAIVLMGWLSRSAHGQWPRAEIWATDGPVYAVAQSHATTYVGGSFSLVGPSTGGGVPLHLRDGRPVEHFPKVAGTVVAAVPDGQGGWFIGGAFSAVGGKSRANLARVLINGDVDAWNPAANNNVNALAIKGHTLYVGGGFTAIAGARRSCLAALDVATGRALAWGPVPTGGALYTAVFALLVREGIVVLAEDEGLGRDRLPF